MSYWENVDTQEKEFSIGGDNLPLIPNKTVVLATCEEAKNARFKEEAEYISIKWRISQPAQFANRTVFQNLKVNHEKAETSNKHRQMLSAIANNAGRRLFQEMEANNEREPSNASLATLTNKSMSLLVGIWESDDKKKSGNFVIAVSPKNEANVVQQETQKPAMQADQLDAFNEVPF